MAFLAITKKKNQAASKQPLPDVSAIAADQLLISQAAAQAILAKAEQEDAQNAYFRVGVQGGGCAGMSYLFTFEHTLRPQDRVFEAHGVKVCIDPKSLQVLGGSLLDYEDEGMRKVFRLINSRSVKNCSCGKSFSL